MLTNNTRKRKPRKRKPRNSEQRSSRSSQQRRRSSQQRSRSSQQRSNSAQQRSNSAQKRRRISTKKSFVAPDPEVGRFYVLNPEPNGFRALYLTLEKMDDSTILAQSCPPINYPEPNYYIRGMQQDPMPKSILKDEIKMSKMTQIGVNTILTDANGHYTITLSTDWIKKNNHLWESIKSNYSLTSVSK